MNRRLHPFLLVVAAASPAYGQCLLHDNGPFVTHPAQGRGCAGGFDISMSEAAPMNVAGSSARVVGAGPHARVADTFVVEDCPGWTIDHIIVYAYESAFDHPQPPTWDLIYMNIWKGDKPGPGGGAQLVTVSISQDWTFTGVFRTFNGVYDNCQRGIYAIRFDFRCRLKLEPGRYWLDWQIHGGTNGWANYVMHMEGPEPKVTPGTAMHMIDMSQTWEPMLVVNGFPVQPSLPFQVWGCDPRISVSGECPGQVRVEWCCAPPNKVAGLLFGFAHSPSPAILSGPCAGVRPCLGTLPIQLVTTFNTGPNGEGSISGFASQGACKRYLQVLVVDGQTCRPSNVAQIP